MSWDPSVFLLSCLILNHDYDVYEVSTAAQEYLYFGLPIFTQSQIEKQIYFHPIGFAENQTPAAKPEVQEAVEVGEDFQVTSFTLALPSWQLARIIASLHWWTQRKDQLLFWLHRLLQPAGKPTLLKFHLRDLGSLMLSPNTTFHGLIYGW